MDKQTEAKDFDTMADELLNEAGMETLEDSSSSAKPEDETKTPETPTAEVDKTEKVKEVEDDSSLSVEDKIAKIKELLGDDEKALDAYIKTKGYHNDPAWQKQREIIDKLKKESEAGALSEEDKTALEDFKKLRSSPDFIRMTMKEQGFTQEAIDKKLQESGFDIQSKPQDDVQLVAKGLGLDINSLSKEQKNYVEEVTKMADIIIKDRMDKALSKELEPIQEHMQTTEKSNNATKMLGTMQETVKSEGILDFKEDIEPELNKFIDANPNCVQQDILEHFKTINHTLSVERLKTGKRKDERDDKKSTLRQNIPLSGVSKTAPKKTGNFEADADAFFEALI